MASWAKRIATAGAGSSSNPHHDHYQGGSGSAGSAAYSNRGQSLIPVSSSQPIEYIPTSNAQPSSSRFRHVRGTAGSGPGTLSTSLSASGLNFAKLFSKTKGKGRQFDQNLSNLPPSEQLHTEDFAHAHSGLGLTLDPHPHPQPQPPAPHPSELRLSTGEAFLMANGATSSSRRDSSLFGGKSNRRRSSAKTTTTSSKSPGQRHSISIFRPTSPTLPQIDSQRIQAAERSQRIEAAERDVVCPLLAPDQVRGLSPSINAQLQSFAFPSASANPSPDPANEPKPTQSALSSRQLRGKSRSMGNALELANMASHERASYERRRSKPSIPADVQQPDLLSSSERKRAISMMDNGPTPSATARPRNLARKFSLLRYGRNGPVGEPYSQQGNHYAETGVASSGTGGATQSTPRRRPDNAALAASTSASTPNAVTAATSRKTTTSPFSFRKLSIKRLGGTSVPDKSRNDVVRTPEIQEWREQGASRRQSQMQEDLVEPPVMLVQPSFDRTRSDPPHRLSSAASDENRDLWYSYEATAPSSLKRNNSGSTSLRRMWQTRSKSFDLLTRSSRSNPASRAGSEVSSSASRTPVRRKVREPSKDSLVPRKPVPSYDRNEAEVAHRMRKASNPTSIVTSASVANEPITVMDTPTARSSSSRARLRGGLSPHPSVTPPPSHFTSQLDAISIHHNGETTDAGGYSDVASTVRPPRVHQQLLAPEDAIASQSGKRSDPNDSIGSTNSAGRPYSMISMGSGDTPIVRYRRLVVDTTEGEHEDDNGEVDHTEGEGPQRDYASADHDGLWFRKPGKQRANLDRVFDGEASPRLGETADAHPENADSITPLVATNATMDRRTSGASTKRGSALISDADTALSALEAEVTTAKRLVVGRSRANTLDLMKHIEQEQSANERVEGARAREADLEPHTATQGQEQVHALPCFVVPRTNLQRSASTLGLTTSTSSDDDGSRHPSPLIEGLHLSKSVFLPNSTVPKLPSASALRRSRSALAARSPPNSSPDEGVKPDEFEPPRPRPNMSKVSFRSRRDDDETENGIGGEDGDTGKTRHIKSKSSLRSRASGKKHTFATSEEAIQARQREEEGREKRRLQREREKEKVRQRRYADMKKNDPLLAERLALVGLRPGVGLGVDVGPAGDTETPAVTHHLQWPSAEPAPEEMDSDATPRKVPTTQSVRQTASSPASSPPTRLVQLVGLNNRSSLEDSLSFERPKRASLLSQNPVNAEAEIVRPAAGTASGLMADLARSPSMGSHRILPAGLKADGASPQLVAGAQDEAQREAQPSNHRQTQSLSLSRQTPDPAEEGSAPPMRRRTRGDSTATTSLSTSQMGTPIPSLDFPDPPERQRESRSADGTVLSMGELTSPMTQWSDEAQMIAGVGSSEGDRPRRPLFIYAPNPADAVSASGNASAATTPRATTFPQQEEDPAAVSKPVLKSIRRSRSKVIKPPVGPRPQPRSTSPGMSPPNRSATLSSSFGMGADEGGQGGQDSRHRSMMVQIEHVADAQTAELESQ